MVHVRGLEVLKSAILVAMAEEPPFDQIYAEAYPELIKLYENYGFQTFFVSGRPQTKYGRRLRRSLEEIRWSKFHIFLRIYDLFVLAHYKFLRPQLKTQGHTLRVNVPEDLRHLSIKILSSVSYLEEQGFNTIVRTTISSILNPKLLRLVARISNNSDEIFYGGRRIDQADGFSFVSGSFTVWNSKAVRMLKENRSSLDFSLIDDVCFGRLFRKKEVKIQDFPSVNLSSLSEISTVNNLSEIVHFRCRTGTRDRNDLEVMNSLLNSLKKVM